MTSIEFSIWNFLTSVGQPTIPIAHITVAPTEIIQAEVRSCKYKVQVNSQWQGRAGFRPVVASTFEAELDFPPAPGGQPATVDVTAEVTNVMFGSPVGGCVPTFTAPKSTVDIHATRDPTTGRLLLSFFYDQVRVSTAIRCPGIGGGRNDTASHLAAPLLNLRFS